MDRDELVSLLPLIGLIITVSSFLIYIFVPNVAFIALFVLGVIILIGSYVFMSVRISGYHRAIEEREAERYREPYIECLDGEYIPENDYATIEDLRGF
jgi:hypothetical protein